MENLSLSLSPSHPVTRMRPSPLPPPPLRACLLCVSLAEIQIDDTAEWPCHGAARCRVCDPPDLPASLEKLRYLNVEESLEYDSQS